MAGDYRVADSLLHDSDDDLEAILYEDDDDDDVAASPVHPIPSMQGAFDESILESIEQTDSGHTPARELMLGPEGRRQKLLDGGDYNNTYNAKWKKNGSSKYHPLSKVMAQIAFGIHLLYCQMARSDDEVIKILQKHIDEVDNFIQRTEEDIQMATTDIRERINHLKLPLEHVNIFDVMLEDRQFRLSILDGNEKIEKIVNRTAELRSDMLVDISKAIEAARDTAEYLTKIGPSWPSSTSSMGLYHTMLANMEGWLNWSKNLHGQGRSLGSLLTHLSSILNEMAKRAGVASRKNLQARARSPPTSSLVGQVQPGAILGLRKSSRQNPQTSSQRSAKQPAQDSTTVVKSVKDSFPKAQDRSIPPLPPESLEIPYQQVLASQKSQEISSKRASTATIASLFHPAREKSSMKRASMKSTKSVRSTKASKSPKTPKSFRFSLSGSPSSPKSRRCSLSRSSCSSIPPIPMAGDSSHSIPPMPSSTASDQNHQTQASPAESTESAPQQAKSSPQVLSEPFNPQAYQQSELPSNKPSKDSSGSSTTIQPNSTKGPERAAGLVRATSVKAKMINVKPKFVNITNNKSQPKPDLKTNVSPPIAEVVDNPVEKKVEPDVSEKPKIPPNRPPIPPPRAATPEEAATGIVLAEWPSPPSRTASPFPPHQTVDSPPTSNPPSSSSSASNPIPPPLEPTRLPPPPEPTRPPPPPRSESPDSLKSADSARPTDDEPWWPSQSSGSASLHSESPQSESTPPEVPKLERAVTEPLPAAESRRYPDSVATSLPLFPQRSEDPQSETSKNEPEVAESVTQVDSSRSSSSSITALPILPFYSEKPESALSKNEHPAGVLDTEAESRRSSGSSITALPAFPQRAATSPPESTTMNSLMPEPLSRLPNPATTKTETTKIQVTMETLRAKLDRIEEAIASRPTTSGRSQSDEISSSKILPKSMKMGRRMAPTRSDTSQSLPNFEAPRFTASNNESTDSPPASVELSRPQATASSPKSEARIASPKPQERTDSPGSQPGTDIPYSRPPRTASPGPEKRTEKRTESPRPQRTESPRPAQPRTESPRPSTRDLSTRSTSPTMDQPPPFGRPPRTESPRPATARTESPMSRGGRNESPLRMNPVYPMEPRTASPRPDQRTDSPRPGGHGRTDSDAPSQRTASPRRGRPSPPGTAGAAPPRRSGSQHSKASTRPESPASQLQSESESSVTTARTELLAPRIPSLDFSESPPPVPPKDDHHRVSPVIPPGSPRSLVSQSTTSQAPSRVSSASTPTQAPSVTSTTRFQPPKPIDTSHPKRALSPLAPDSAYSTGSKFTMSTRDSIDKPPESPSRPTTSRSTKPFSRSRLALFPSTTPSLVSLRGRSEITLPLKDHKLEKEEDGGIGEHADSALPTTNAKGVRKVGSLGMLKKFGERIGFTRRRTAVDVGP